jgi:ligand-binding sensor protein
MNCTVHDIKGTPISGKPNWCNELCPKIKSDKDSISAICSPSNQYFMEEARKTGKPVIGECEVGFLKLAVPIFINGEFLGTAGGCGLIPAGGEIEPFIITKTLGMSEQEVQDLCQGIKVMKEPESHAMAEYINQCLSEFKSASDQKTSASG